MWKHKVSTEQVCVDYIAMYRKTDNILKLKIILVLLGLFKCYCFEIPKAIKQYKCVHC